MDSESRSHKPITMQQLMAVMVHSSTKVVVMEASSKGLAERSYDELYIDVAVFSNLTRDHLDYHLMEKHHKMSKGNLFAKTVDPERQRKVVKIDDHNYAYFIEQGAIRASIQI